MRKLALQRCLDRIQTMEPSIHAWVQVSPQRNATLGRLSGIPYGVKDIVEARDLATEYGSPIYKGRIGTTDAAIIREMRKHGAILLGKTQTTAFAYLTPAPTRNPRDLEHTPGGSSSGSAGRSCGGHGSVRYRRANPGVRVAARLFLRRYGVQTNLWSSLNGGRVTAVEEPGHAGVFHSHAR